MFHFGGRSPMVFGIPSTIGCDGLSLWTGETIVVFVAEEVGNIVGNIGCIGSYFGDSDHDVDAHVDCFFDFRTCVISLVEECGEVGCSKDGFRSTQHGRVGLAIILIRHFIVYREAVLGIV